MRCAVCTHVAVVSKHRSFDKVMMAQEHGCVYCPLRPAVSRQRHVQRWQQHWQQQSRKWMPQLGGCICVHIGKMLTLPNSFQHL